MYWRDVAQPDPGKLFRKTRWPTIGLQPYFSKFSIDFPADKFKLDGVLKSFDDADDPFEECGNVRESRGFLLGKGIFHSDAVSVIEFPDLAHDTKRIVVDFRVAILCPILDHMSEMDRF